MFSRGLCKIVAVSMALAMISSVVPFLSSEVFASSAPAKEEPKEGEAPAEPVNEAQKKQANEALELQSKVQALQAKVRAKDESIRHLIAEKNHTTDAARVEEIIKQMVTEHKEMNKLIQEYEQNRSLLRYRYPEKGFQGSRTYERMEAKPLDQIESQMSIEAKLDQTLKTVQSQYGVPPKDPKVKPKKKGPSAPSLTEPIVIQK